MKHPFSTNFKTLLQYDFTKTTIEDVIFFEWLVVKRESFGNIPFFYQQNRIIDELGIKRTRLKTVTDKFKSMGLKIELAGKWNVTHFTVSDKFIKAFVRIGVKKDLQKDLLNRILDFNMNRTVIKNRVDKNYLDFMIVQLNRKYNSCRTLSAKEKGITYSKTELPCNKKTHNQLSLLSTKYETTTIVNTFQAFCDAIVSGKDHTSHMLNNFSSYDENEDRFPVFERYLTQFNSEYAIRD